MTLEEAKELVVGDKIIYNGVFKWKGVECEVNYAETFYYEQSVKVTIGFYNKKEDLLLTLSSLFDTFDSIERKEIIRDKKINQILHDT